MNNDFTEPLEEWLTGFLDEPGYEHIRSRATEGLELLDEAYSLPWWRLLARRKLFKATDNLWRGE
jgi:hypothetical protein